ncbi:PAM [Mytilus edulis]|uniref:PAM n=1 Tax=Mytilus edulis TaxID=6550 RepID=A0A8S3RJL2_MYTED|nr:PAM [Mytilus edulis]
MNHEFVHHADLSFCEEPEEFASHKPWECSKNRKYCKGGAVGVYFLDDYYRSKEGKMTYPKDVSLKVGFSTIMRHICIEMHTKAAVIGYFAEVACRWDKPDVVAYAVQVHTHHVGYMADVFRVRNGTWTLLASQLTQGKAKVLVPVPGGFIDVRQGDILAAKCLYITKDSNPVRFGESDGQEMCNVDIQLGYEFKHEESFKRSSGCMTQHLSFRFVTTRRHQEFVETIAK